MARTPNTQTREEEEHRTVGSVEAKAVIPYVYDAFSGTANPGAGSLVGVAYDYITASPNLTTPTTITFKSGGSGGTTVATLTFAYSGSDITSIVRT